MSKILITGMSGLIGTALGNRLKDSAELAALNRSAVEGIPTTCADLGDFDAIRPHGRRALWRIWGSAVI